MDFEIVVVLGCVILSAACLAYWYRLSKKIDEENSYIVGTLRVDCSDEDGPYMFLELGVPIEEIVNKAFEFLILGNFILSTRKVIFRESNKVYYGLLKPIKEVTNEESYCG